MKLSFFHLSPQVLLASLLAFFMVGCSMKLNPYSLDTTAVSLSLNQTNISFDEISYDSRLNRIVIPAAETGKLILIDPHTMTKQLISGFSTGSTSAGKSASAFGTTSAVSVKGTLFAIDRAQKKILLINPETGLATSSTALQETPDYVRFVAAKNEIWVTETAGQQIETFSISAETPPRLEKTDAIKVQNGPEYLLIDNQRGLAFTNKPENGVTAVIQVNTHGVIDEWGNGCTKAHGMAIDEDRGYLFVACNEGKVVVMDINNRGHQLTSQNYGGAVDFVAYNPELKHIYVPSAASAIVAVFEIKKNNGTPTPNAASSTDGEAAPQSDIRLVRLGTADTGMNARCVTTDVNNNIWLCDPVRGQLFLIRDTFPAGGSE
jgi:DNA-binding beta-propeller fold protein YncE